jgi:hypothetical protein
MDEITFIVHPAEEGGYWAEAEGFPLFTQAESLDELSSMVLDAVGCFFADPLARPKSICWRFAQQDIAA